MKKYLHATIIAIISCLLMIPGASAQTTKSSYFMTSSHARHYLNPALHPENGYIGIPGVNNVFADARTNTFTLENFIFLYREDPSAPVKPMTFMHKDVPAEKFLANISRHNYVSVNADNDVFSAGFRAGRGYWTIHAGLRTRVDVDVPRGLFELLKKGFVDQDASSTRYDLSGLSASAKAYMEMGAGYSRSFLGKRLVVGLRPKVLLGVGDAKLNVEQLEVDAGTNYWNLKSRATLQVSAPGITPEYDNDFENLSGFEFEWKGIPGYGAGVDVGASFHLFDFGLLGKLTVSAAVNNIGFMTWSAKNSYQARTNETTVTITPNDYSVHQNDYTSSIEDVLDDVVDDLERGLDFFNDPANSGKKRSSRLDMDFNIGVEYAVFRNKLSLGALYSNTRGEDYSMGQCTFSLNYRPCSWFAASASYALFEKSSNSVGLAIHLAPRVGPTLFLASDCAITKINPQGIPLRGYNMNAQVGLAFNIGGGDRER
ncbi:MAG: DUF5723 family protein [Odoribacteraceae bacterium]|nr:DUF5723 family protein [Odoribacteraceae bacterium]